MELSLSDPNTFDLFSIWYLNFLNAQLTNEIIYISLKSFLNNLKINLSFSEN